MWLMWKCEILIYLTPGSNPSLSLASSHALYNQPLQTPSLSLLYLYFISYILFILSLSYLILSLFIPLFFMPIKWETNSPSTPYKGECLSRKSFLLKYLMQSQSKVDVFKLTFKCKAICRIPEHRHRRNLTALSERRSVVSQC